MGVRAAAPRVDAGAAQGANAKGAGDLEGLLGGAASDVGSAATAGAGGATAGGTTDDGTGSTDARAAPPFANALASLRDALARNAAAESATNTAATGVPVPTPKSASPVAVPVAPSALNAAQLLSLSAVAHSVAEAGTTAKISGTAAASSAPTRPGRTAKTAANPDASSALAAAALIGVMPQVSAPIAAMPAATTAVSAATSKASTPAAMPAIVDAAQAGAVQSEVPGQVLSDSGLSAAAPATGGPGMQSVTTTHDDDDAVAPSGAARPVDARQFNAWLLGTTGNSVAASNAGARDVRSARGPADATNARILAKDTATTVVAAASGGSAAPQAAPNDLNAMSSQSASSAPLLLNADAQAGAPRPADATADPHASGAASGAVAVGLTGSNATALAATSAPVVRSIPIPVTDRAWPQAAAAQVHWLAARGIQSATLKLAPEHLGPVEVRIDLQQSQVNVSFSAAHAETRSALEQCVPQLRDLLAGSGLSLGQANVQQQNAQPQPPTQSRSNDRAASDESVQSIAVGAATIRGLVDEYA